MFDDVMNEILEPNKRIKKIRKITLRCTQSDLACSNLTREMISQIENKKRNLTWDTARLISQNINNYAKIHGIVFNITDTELMKSEIEQAHDRVISYTRDLKNLIVVKNSSDLFLTIFNEINMIIENYRIDRSLIFEFYMINIDFFSLNSLLGKAKRCILKSFLMSNSEEEQLRSLIKLTKIAHYLTAYDDVIYICEYTLDFYKKNKFDIANNVKCLQDLYYNLALAYKDKGEYNKCYEIFTIVSNLKISFLNLDVLYVNCLLEEKKYIESEKKCFSILHTTNFTNDAENLFRIYRNLGVMYLETNRLNKSDEYTQLAINAKCHKTNIELAYLYYYSFIINLKIGYGDLKVNASFDKAIEMCEKACIGKTIEMREKACIDELQIRLYNRIITHYIQHKNNYEVMQTIDKLEMSISGNHLSNEKYFHIFNIAAKYFLENNQNNDANIVLQKSINTSSNFSESNFF